MSKIVEKEKLIKDAIKRKLIKISEDEKQITYIHQNKTRNYQNPEEKVQCEAYCRLVLQYNYKPLRIRMYEPVKMGSETKEADIIVYNDDECLQPHILVECKREEVSEQEFQQAIEQAYSYAYALPNEIKFVWVTSGIRNEYFEVDKGLKTRLQQPDIPQYGVGHLASYKYVYCADELPHEEGKQQFSDLVVIDQAELTKRFKQAHDALWAGGQLNPSEAFDELDKLIFCKIWDERKDRKAGEPYDFQIFTVTKEEEKDAYKRRQKENESLCNRVLTLYEEGRQKDSEVFRDSIRLSPEKIRTVVGYLQAINLGETDLDSKGRAFETFMGSFFRGSFGQYFTPRTIVKFMVDVLPIKKDSYVLDTSCGSGGFLLYALNKVREQATALYPKYKTDVKQHERWYKYWHDFAENYLYGIEINEQISRAAKMNMIIHDDGHTNVISSDGLVDVNQIETVTKNRGFKYNHFHFIITNPPFGSIIRMTEKAYMKTYDLGKKKEDWLALAAAPETPRVNQSSEILFIEQAYKYLREGGYLGIVVPDGILTNSSLQYVRDRIEDWFRIVAVVSMPQTAFNANGAGVKSSVLFLRKWTGEEKQKFEKTKKKIQDDLLIASMYREKVLNLEAKKKEQLKKLEGFDNTTGFTVLADIKKTEAYKSWSSEISAKYTDEINSLKEKLTDLYQNERQKQLPDYRIFMAIAEEIGYDATGKVIANNDLEVIGEKLKEFIAEEFED